MATFEDEPPARPWKAGCRKQTTLDDVELITSRVTEIPIEKK